MTPHYIHKDTPKYKWTLISVGTGIKSYFEYDGIGYQPFCENITVINEGIYRSKYLNGDWWKKNTYRRLIQDDTTSDIYIVNDIKNKPSIKNVIDNKMEFREWFKESTEVFWKQNPTKLNDVFATLITRLNKKYKLSLVLNVTKQSYQSLVYVVDKKSGNELILTWKNCG